MKRTLLFTVLTLVAVLGARAESPTADALPGLPNRVQPTQAPTRAILRGVTFNPTVAAGLPTPTPTPRRPILHGVTFNPTVAASIATPTPGTIDFKALMEKAQDDKCESLAALDDRTSGLHKDVTKLAARYKALSSDLGDIAKVLSIPSKLVTALDKTIASLKAVRAGLETAEAVPQIREKAQKLKESVQGSLEEAISLRTKAERIAKQVAPAQKAAQGGSTGFGQASLTLTLFDIAALRNEPAATSMIQYSIDYFPEPRRDCVQGKVDPKANNATTLVVELDRAVTVLLYEPDVPGIDPLRGLADKLKASALNDLLGDVGRLDKRIAKLDGPLKAVEKLLDESFKVDFGLYKVKVSGRVIAKGADAIESEIEHLLGKLAWKAAKEFGVKKLVNALTKDANKAFKKAYSKLDFDADVHLPGLDRLDPLESELSGLVKAIPTSLAFPVLNLHSPDFGIPGIQASMDLRGIQTFLTDISEPYGFEWAKVWDKFKLKPPTLGCP